MPSDSLGTYANASAPTIGRSTGSATSNRRSTMLPLGRRFAAPLTGRCRGRFPFVVNGLILKLFEIVRMRNQKRMTFSNTSHVFDEIVFGSVNWNHTRRGRNENLTL